MKLIAKNKFKFEQLRKRAEKLLVEYEEDFSDVSPEYIKKLVHELTTHQIELELQNEDLKKVRVLLEESRDNYCELFDFAPCGYLKLKQNGIISDANFTATELLGIVKTNLINKKFTDFIVNECQDEFYKIYSSNNDLNFGKSCELKLKIGKKDFWVHLEVKVLKLTNNSNYSYLITFNDISKQKYLQFFNDLSRNINDSIFFINPEDYKFIDINGQAIKSLGYTRDELLTMSVVDIEPFTADEIPWKKRVEEVFRKGNMLVEGVHKRKDNTVFPVEINISTTSYSNHKYIVAIARDITERKKTEQMIIQSQKMQAADALAAGMAHEFNNIIGIIMGYSQILIDREHLTEEATKNLNIIYHQAEKAAIIIDDILKFSQKNDFSLELTNLEDLLDETIKMISLLLPPNISVSCNIEKNLPLIKCNTVQIQQALINISNNSVQAMGTKKGTLRFTLVLADDYPNKKSQNSPFLKNCIKLFIEDEGCGMSEDVINQAFNPFFTTKKDSKGTGLGLSVVYSIVKFHKGEITLKSKENIGTEICMYFPSVSIIDVMQSHL